MLTRLKVSGFKNLVDVDLRFGPFTCIAGANGVGKSNLLDAILFLGALADRPLLEAAMSVRDDTGRTGDLLSLFHVSSGGTTDRMSFEAEMLVPSQGHDDLGQTAKATITFLRYTLSLGYRPAKAHDIRPGLELLEESLSYVSVGDAKQNLLFPHSAKWRRSVVHGRRTSQFISTEAASGDTTIKLHGDGGKVGRTRWFSAQTLPRTLLSSANAAESPTALLARREMQSWRLLQLEPSALRAPDPYTAPTRMGSNGAHLPATLYYLSREGGADKDTGEDKEAQVSARIANRLAQLLDDVRQVRVRRDDKRELLTLEVCGRDGIPHPARALSDGTLRFLAIAVLEQDPRAYGLLCLEEPENGIHPERIGAMLSLLQDLAVDPEEAVDATNPLQQVIVNTHSPAVVAQVPEGSLLFAERAEGRKDGHRFDRLVFRSLPGTWRTRAQPETEPIPKGKILAFLNPVPFEGPSSDAEKEAPEVRKVIERPDIRQLVLGFPGREGNE